MAAERPLDIGIVARRFPDVNFLIDHSGYVTTVAEQAYDASGTRDGIDTLITSLRRHGVPPNSNVYAELGSTWRFLMRDPEQAAHALGGSSWNAASTRAVGHR